MRHPAALLATWFGVGLSPLAPGSWGSLVALPIAWAIRSRAACPGLAVAVAVVFAVGWWAAAVVAEASDIADPGAVVIDEVAGQSLVLLAAPFDPARLGTRPSCCSVCSTSGSRGRCAGPIGISSGGLGIMLDDMMAAGYALVAMLALARGFRQFSG